MTIKFPSPQKPPCVDARSTKGVIVIVRERAWSHTLTPSSSLQMLIFDSLLKRQMLNLAFYLAVLGRQFWPLSDTNQPKKRRNHL